MKGNPLSEATFYILLALSQQPLHGYGIIKRVEEISEERIILAAGTLYGALSNLKATKLIRQLDNMDDSNRKVYQITEDGLGVLMNDYNRIRKLCDVAGKILKKGD